MIKVSSLTKIFPPDCKAVDGLELHVREGEIFGFLGPNGAGKTTTIKILSTLSAFNSGSVYVAGYDVAKEPVKVRESIGYVAQDTGVDYFLTGRENLILQGRMYRMKKSIILERIEELGMYFGMTKYLDNMVSTYSGGMRRNLDIATALIHRPKLLFLDEPTLGLDIKSRQSLWEYIKKLNKELGLTILLTTHYLEEADMLSHRVAIINAGKIGAIGTPEELKVGIKGDAVILSFEKVDSKVKKFAEELGRAPYVRDNVWYGEKLHLYVKNGGESISKIISEVVSAGIVIKTTSLSRPTLDDVFLKYTGVSMLEPKEEAQEEWWTKWAGKGGGGNWKKWAGSWDENSDEGEGSDSAHQSSWSAEEIKAWQEKQGWNKPADASSQEGSGESDNNDASSSTQSSWSAEEIKAWQEKQGWNKPAE